MTQLRIASFNVHWGVRPDRRTPYALLDALRQLDTDVIVLQELFRPDDDEPVDVSLRADGYESVFLALARAEASPKARRRSWGGSGNWGIAVLSRCPVIEHHAVPIGRAFLDHIGHRNALHTVIDVAGTRLPVVGVHTSSRVPWGPTANLLTLRRQLPSTDAPAIVAGDCNFWGPAVVRLLPGWNRAVFGATWPAHRPHSQIDHILVPTGVRVRSGEVLDDVGSDHRPVRAWLEW